MRRFWIYLLLLSACGTLHAQTFNLQTGREPVASLDGLWRFHTGDNPAWASPSFDDSQWPLLRSDKSWSAQGYKGYGGYAWYRFTIQDPSGDKPLALLLTGIATSYRVYADGKLIGGYGYLPPRALTLLPRPATYPLPPASQSGPRTIHIAIRVWQNPEWALYQPGGTLSPGNNAGDSTIILQRVHTGGQALSSRLASPYAYSILAALFGLLVFGLFLFRPAEREYLWFALVLLVSAADAALHIGDSLSFIAIEISDLIEGCIFALFSISALLFFSRVLRTRRTFWWWLACVTAFLSSVTTFLYLFHWTSVPVSGACQLILGLPTELWIFAVLVRSAARKDADARLLLFPVLLMFGFNFIDSLVGIAFQLGWWTRGFSLNPIVLRFPFDLGLRDIVFIIFVFAMMLFLVRRFALARREEERLSGELEAARNMQSLLVPATPPDTPGFTIESIYIPASEVGGDFFQILPGDDGSLLIVVGDVSGKGLKAAMTVSAIIGALRNEKERRPSEVLRNLNRVLHGQITGFATCTAALIASDGAITIANAGNLAPYCNGKEMAVDPGLPLGILADTTYSETSYQLNPNDRITFVSDGVVEATNEKRELFGFERTQAISGQSANAIAEIAKKFGQQDDISVLSVTRTANLKTALAI